MAYVPLVMVYSHFQPGHSQEVWHLILDEVPSGRDTHHPLSSGCECRLHDGARTAAGTQKAHLRRGKTPSTDIPVSSVTQGSWAHSWWERTEEHIQTKKMPDKSSNTFQDHHYSGSPYNSLGVVQQKQTTFLYKKSAKKKGENNRTTTQEAASPFLNYSPSFKHADGTTKFLLAEVVSKGFTAEQQADAVYFPSTLTST